MSAAVAIIGTGVLADQVAGRLSGSGLLKRYPDWREAKAEEAHLALVLSDGWEPAAHRYADEHFRAAGTPWLRGFAVFGEGAVGPLVRPDTSGCSWCADVRRTMAGSDRPENGWLLRRTAEREERRPESRAASVGLSQLACLLADEAFRFLEGRPVRTDNRMFLLQLTTLRMSRHFVLPDPMCPVCGANPEDTETGARIRLQSCPKSGNAYRTKPLETLREALETEYLDYRTGLLNGKFYDLQSPFADASVNLPLPQGDEGTAGRTNRYSDSLPAAILEGLERHCGLMPSGKRTVVRDSFHRLGSRALDPLSVGVHAADQYEQPDFPFRPFDPEEPVDWVWGYSFLREQPILVPESLAYYSTGGSGHVYETSNGCALGGSLEEAVFYGILEVVERDSFLLTWYAQLAQIQLDPRTSGDRELTLMIHRLETVAGCEVLLFDATMEHGIPAIWSMARSRDRGGVNLICAAGAHPDPVRAAKSSVHELSAMLLSQNEKFERNRELYREMLADPYQVRQMEDHGMLYALPEAESRLSFLLNGGKPKPFGEVYRPPSRHSDLTDDLVDLLQALRRSGLEVIAVDQSTPETLRNGLHCVKILIPGMLPMTFGYHLTRLAGLERVLTVPAKLGFTDRALTPDRLNRHPHPFP